MVRYVVFLNELLESLSKDWALAQHTQPDYYEFACFVPVREYFTTKTKNGKVMNVNQPGVGHGKGDLIVASNYLGTPNLSDLYVVNGIVFSVIYNSKGWDNFIIDVTDHMVKKDSLPKLTFSMGGKI